MSRMRILTASEQDTFDKPPLLDYRERKVFFNFPQKLMEVAATLRTPDGRIGFLLLCGYFKASGKFYYPHDFHERDICVVIKKLGLDDSSFLPDSYAKQTRARHHKIILDFYGFSSFDECAKEMLSDEIRANARAHLKPRLIFDRSTDFLVQNRIQIPQSGTIIEMIRTGLQARKTELIALIEANLTDEARTLLEQLFTAPDEQSRYRLTLLKKLSQSTKPARIKESIKDFEVLADLYRQLEGVISALNLGTSGTRYFAGSVLKSQIFQLHQRTEADRYIHAVAFIAHQYSRMHDNLVDIWLNAGASFQTTVSREHKERLLENRKAQQERLKSVMDTLDTGVLGLIQSIRNLTDADALSDTEKVAQIRALLSDKKADSINRLKADIETAAHDSCCYEVLESYSLRLQNRLNPILRALEFESNDRVPGLIEAIENIKRNNGNISEQAPTAILDADERKALIREDATFRPSLYKVFLFQRITGAIKSGDLNFALSYKYRPLDAYLIDKERWQHDKTALLERAGLIEFANPEPVLAELDEILYAQYRKTNGRFSDNAYLKVRADGKLYVTTPAVDDGEDNPLIGLFPERHDVPLALVLETVYHHCGMRGAFEHWQQTHIRQALSRALLLAGIMGLGCGIGVRKMARISSQVSENELEHAVNWRFSRENIRAANDTVVKAMDSMELPGLYRNKKDVLHTASDGQKFEVRGESLHAGRSFKYFGQGQGISAYTFVDERHFLWHSLMISASDRESAYVIDGLMHNDVVKSDIHSTDTHGYTEAVFGLTHLLGFSFAPRIKGIGKQTLYIFKPKNRVDANWAIQPSKTITENPLRENWDDLLRLVTTIKLKENTASDIFRRLNSYSRQHALYQTLKAFGQIIKSLFILRYIDDLALRQAIDKQLNKVELANRFTRAVAVGNPREFTQAEKEEQEIAEACNRLIKNSIICWNYLYLTRKIEKAGDDDAKENLRRAIGCHSPMSWAHINMLGEYDFSDEKLKDALGILPLKSAT